MQVMGFEIQFFHFVVMGVAIVMLPLIIDALNSFLPQAGVGRLAQEAVGYFLIITISLLILTAYIEWWFSFLPYHMTYFSLPWNTYGTFHICFATWTVFHCFYHYERAITLGPGHPLKKRKKEDNEVIEEVKLPQCDSCKTTKPERAHHCKICAKCALKMDHHCPFIGNCVGLKNQRHFILFLSFLTVGDLYATYLSYLPFRDCVWKVRFYDVAPDRLLCSIVGDFKYIVVCTLLLLIPLGFLLFWQVFVVYTNVTTLEALKKMRITPIKKWIKLFWEIYKNGNIGNITKKLGGNTWLVFVL